MGGKPDRAATILDAALPQAYHEHGDEVAVSTYQDVEPHMDYCAKVRRAESEERTRFGRRPDLHRTMSVPFNVILGIAQRLGIPQGQIFQSEQQKRIMKELKGPEFAAFRVTNDKRI